jgi:formylglycine-generating enzyme required for sulfatase activity
VLRGGSWHGYLRSARCAARFRLLPDYYNTYVGFRVFVSRRLLNAEI